MCKSKFYDLEKEIIGNVIIYIAHNVKEKDNVSLSKLLRLLYLIDESSVKVRSTPVTWLDYYAWKSGVVADDVRTEIIKLGRNKAIDKGLSLGEFISVFEEIKNERIYTYISSKKDFNDQIFSERQLDVMKGVLQKYGDWSTDALNEETTKSGTLYDQVVKSNNLSKVFDIKNETNFPIDFVYMIYDNPLKSLIYQNSHEALFFQIDFF